MFVKMCGFTRPEDITAAAQLGVQAVGFNFYKKSPRNISPQTAKNLLAHLPADVEPWGLFVNASLDDIRQVLRHVPLKLVQFHGDEDLPFCRALGVPFVKAFRLQHEAEVAGISAWIPHAYESRFLIDTFSAKHYGGTGKPIAPEILQKALQLPGKLILAGGLKPENLSSLLKPTLPYGVDVSSGIEDDALRCPGVKSLARMQDFMRQVQLLEKS